MRKPISVDELDGQILHALQIWPRASWRDLASILSVDPMTAARRWRRMFGEGIAWLVADPWLPMLGLASSRYAGTGSEQSLAAVIELQVRPKWLSEVLGKLRLFGSLRMVRLAVGEWNVSIDWYGLNPNRLEEFVRVELARLKGVQATRVFATVRVLVEGSSWREGVLTSHQVQAIESVRRRDLFDAQIPTSGRHSIDGVVMRLLEENVRMSFVEMAARAQSTVGTVKRHLGHLLRDRDLVIRCDVARPYSGHPIMLRIFAQVGADVLKAATIALAMMPEIRSCSLLIGKYNLMINAWLATVHDAPLFEAKLIERVPGIMVAESDLVLRLLRHGRVPLKDDGLRDFGRVGRDTLG